MICAELHIATSSEAATLPKSESYYEYHDQATWRRMPELA